MLRSLAGASEGETNFVFADTSQPFKSKSQDDLVFDVASNAKATRNL